MQTRTICCKLLTTKTVAESLKETSQCFADACNYVLAIALQEKIHDAIRLHKLCYVSIRKLFGLSANLSVRAIRRVAYCLTRLKGKRKAPKQFKPKSIDYDARIFTYLEQEESISLKTIKGRIRIPLILGEHQRKHLKDLIPTSATLIQKNDAWYIHMIVELKDPPCEGEGIMGIDLGIKNIAATSTGLKIEGSSRRQFKEKRAQIRASLQSKSCPGTRKILKKLSGYERRKIAHENHVLSKKLVEEAKRHNCGMIRMEQLKGIRSRTKTWNKHINRMVASWSFYQLQQFVKYKALAQGITIEFVNPAYTSQTCHLCLQLGSRKGELFTCLTCGQMHADDNASGVIALGGAAVNQPELAVIKPLAKSLRL